MKKRLLALLLVASVSSTAVCEDGAKGMLKRSKDLVVSAPGLVVKYKVESAALVVALVAAHYGLKKYSKWYEEKIAPYVAFRGLRAKLTRKKDK